VEVEGGEGKGDRIERERGRERESVWERRKAEA
jgi:hypothetical protein